MSQVVRKPVLHDGLISYVSEAPYGVAENAVGFHVFVIGINGFAVFCQPLLALAPTQCLDQSQRQFNFVLSLHGLVLLTAIPKLTLKQAPQFKAASRTVPDWNIPARTASRLREEATAMLPAAQ
jgi:hypothetical protein